MCVCVCVCVCVCICMCMPIFMCMLCVCVCVWAYVCVCVCAGNCHTTDHATWQHIVPILDCELLTGPGAGYHGSRSLNLVSEPTLNLSPPERHVPYSMLAWLMIAASTPGLGVCVCVCVCLSVCVCVLECERGC